ncbi:tyrosine-protein phosphatase [Ruoffia sp. FAM 24228]|uniref:tyrosine-protein phosphatase n=1 Tax=Ruoffia sp. FAM 24228 TaxID=3259517 RepID=UPI00388A22AE
MIIDLHSHLIPGVDDGAQTIEQSIELARQAVDEGVEHMVLTPHHRNGKYINYKKDVLESAKALQEAYHQANVNLNVYASQEIRLTEKFLDDLYNGELLPLDSAGKYYLIEFPSDRVPSNAKQVLQELIDDGITPVIAHPERNHELATNLYRLYELVQMGCLTQITTSSYSGYYSETLVENSQQMIEHNLAHILASDVHHMEHRPMNVQAAFERLEKEYGQETVKYFKDNARYIFNGDNVNKKQPIQPKKPRKKWFGLF